MSDDNAEMVSVDQAIQVLNEALEADPDAVWRLMHMETECNRTLKDHPTIQVGSNHLGVTIVRPLGLINGLFGADQDTWGFIAMDLDEGKITRFMRLPPRSG